MKTKRKKKNQMKLDDIIHIYFISFEDKQCNQIMSQAIYQNQVDGRTSDNV